MDNWKKLEVVMKSIMEEEPKKDARHVGLDEFSLRQASVIAAALEAEDLCGSCALLNLMGLLFYELLVANKLISEDGNGEIAVDEPGISKALGAMLDEVRHRAGRRPS